METEEAVWTHSGNKIQRKITMKVLSKKYLLTILFFTLYVFPVAAQTPVACDGVPSTTGWISLGVSADSTLISSKSVYNAGLIGTVEKFDNGVIAGMDWMYDKRASNFETTKVGSQLVSWWSRKDGRNTILEVGNKNSDTTFVEDDIPVPPGFPPGQVEGQVNVHVDILGEDCKELRNFCDTLTPDDKVVYDLSRIVSNVGQDIDEGNLDGREGIIVITPVETCDIVTPVNDAISWNFMYGHTIVVNEGEDWRYGFNMRARQAFPVDEGTVGNRSFVQNYYDATSSVPATKLFKEFSSIGTNPGADLILFSFADFGLPMSEGGVYEALAPSDLGEDVTRFGKFAIIDKFENSQSCTSIAGCFLRIGINKGIPSTDDVIPLPPVGCQNDCGDDDDDTGDDDDDINECDTGNGGCDQICINTDGGFSCTCDEGYTLDINGLNCIEVDECNLGTDNCDENAVCTNSIGSFSCDCNEGFTGNGVTCTPEDTGGDDDDDDDEKEPNTPPEVKFEGGLLEIKNSDPGNPLGPVTINIDLPEGINPLSVVGLPASSGVNCSFFNARIAEEDIDISCEVDNIEEELELILDLCNDGSNAQVAQAIVEIISPDLEEDTEDFIEILVNELKVCQLVTDSVNDEEGCTVASAGSKPSASTLLLLLIPGIVFLRIFTRRLRTQE